MTALSKSIPICLLCAAVMIASCVPGDERSPVLVNKETLPLIKRTPTEQIDGLHVNSELFPLTRQEAKKIADDHWKSDKNAERRSVICDAGMFFTVISFPDLSELSISRRDGTILSSEQLYYRRSENDSVSEGQSIDMAAAVERAINRFQTYSRKNFGGETDLFENYHSSGCDLGDAWLISFILKDVLKLKTSKDIMMLPNHHPPHFIVHKDTGEVVYFNYEDKKRTISD